ncbi:MAG: vWA domain-containing protein [bacterium]
MKDNSLRILLICIVILGIFLGAYEGIWKQGAKKVINSNINMKEKEKEVYLEVIWDASGSMWGREVGVEKIIRSKELLKTFTGELPENINLGLRIFGARKVGDLKDSFLAIPFNENDEEIILNFITNVKPLGKSPIAYSLKKAAEDLDKISSKKCILLVSDGLDNGQIPSESVISELEQKNIVLHIVHIGDINDNNLKLSLKNMAEKTGGSYFTYNEHQKIISTLKQF